jgi:hypothetical protein
MGGLAEHASDSHKHAFAPAHARTGIHTGMRGQTDTPPHARAHTHTHTWRERKRGGA